MVDWDVFNIFAYYQLHCLGFLSNSEFAVSWSTSSECTWLVSASSDVSSERIFATEFLIRWLFTTKRTIYLTKCLLIFILLLELPQYCDIIFDDLSVPSTLMYSKFIINNHELGFDVTVIFSLLLNVIHTGTRTQAHTHLE